MVNREKERVQIDKIINAASKGFPQNLAILGKDGMGKTSLLNYIQARCNITKGIFFSRINVTVDTTEQVLTKFLVKDILDQLHVGLGSFLLGLVGAGKKQQVELIAKRIKGIEIDEMSKTSLKDPLFGILSITSQMLERRSRPEDMFEVSELLREALKLTKKQAKGILILFDEAGYVATEKSISLLQRMRLLCQRKTFKLCIGGSPVLFRKYSKIEPTFLNLFPESNRLRLAPLELNHVYELVEKRLNLVRKHGKGVSPFTKDSLEMLYAESMGNPRYVVRIASFALYLSREDSEVRSEHVKEASDQIYTELGRDLFDRLSNDYRQIVLAIGKYPNSTFEGIRRYLGNVPKSTLSPKINELETLGYISIERFGREKHCTLNRILARYHKLMHE